MFFTLQKAAAILAFSAPLLTHALVARSSSPTGVTSAMSADGNSTDMNSTDYDYDYDDTYENLSPVYIPTTAPVDNVTVIPNSSPDPMDDGYLDDGSGNLAFAGVADYTITDQLMDAVGTAFNASLALVKTTQAAYDAAQSAIEEAITNATVQAQAAIYKTPALYAIQQGIDYFEENADPSDPSFNASAAQYAANVTTLQNYIDDQVSAVQNSSTIAPYVSLIQSVDAAQQSSLASAVQTSNMTSTGNATLDAVCGAGNSYCTSVVDSCGNKKTLANATMAYGYTNGTAAPGTSKNSSCVCVAIPDIGSDPDSEHYTGQCQDLSLLEYTARCACNTSHVTTLCCTSLDGIVYNDPGPNYANWAGLANLNATAPLLRGSSGYIAQDVVYDDTLPANATTQTGNSTSAGAGNSTGIISIANGTVQTS